MDARSILMLREPEDRSEKPDHPAMQWILGVGSALLLLALIVSAASALL